jgi:DNA-binding transcriptional LysR family regulator
MDRWTEIELFVQVAETGSLSRAAQSLELSNAAASRHLSALESRLGARLVERNTRRLYLTDTGQDFFQRAKGILAASPEYLSQHGTPKTPDDLQRHKVLVYTYANKPNELRFSKDGKTSTVNVKGLLESNDGQVLRAAALDGLGILVQPSYILYDDIQSDRLVPVLDDWDMPRLTINLAYPSRKHLSAKVRTFIDFVAERFVTMGYEKKWTARLVKPETQAGKI